MRRYPHTKAITSNATWTGRGPTLHGSSRVVFGTNTRRNDRFRFSAVQIISSNDVYGSIVSGHTAAQERQLPVQRRPSRGNQECPECSRFLPFSNFLYHSRLSGWFAQNHRSRIFVGCTREITHSECDTLGNSYRIDFRGNLLVAQRSL